MPDLNYLAIITATILAFVVGGLWYSPLVFGKIWLKENGKTTEEAAHKPIVYLYSFIFALVSVFVLADLLGAKPELIHALTISGLIGALVFLGLAITYQFSGKSQRLLLIDGGYHLVTFLGYGVVLGFLQ